MTDMAWRFILLEAVCRVQMMFLFPLLLFLGKEGRDENELEQKQVYTISNSRQAACWF